MSVAGESGSDANRNISVVKFPAPKIEGEEVIKSAQSESGSDANRNISLVKFRAPKI